jgi:hypothetical protein
MPILRILQNSPLRPEDLRILVAAYERTLQALGLKDRSDPITELVAKKIIEIGQTGLRDPKQISRARWKSLGQTLSRVRPRILSPSVQFPTANS